ncbi:unnamed protein product [Rotaria magnacalcarata]|uniref:Uncharacterized protein n=1 Tax=Rotaria magnacalcarata TaxID=392030 RepID=A0A8S2NEH0_9BILA|nr:unnamed protein product [Rotaria magnacalcarata]
MMVFYRYGNGIDMSSSVLFWLCLTIAPDLLVLLIVSKSGLEYRLRVTYYWRKIFLVPIQMEQAVLDRVAQLIRAPAADIFRPSATLKQPIKHVFIIVLESIRADAVPLNESLANAVNLNFTSDTTAETVTPLLSSLWMNSVRTIASVASSYTLKSLLSIFCGIYPINVNFLKEANPENILYEKCLPELLREFFPTNNNEKLTYDVANDQVHLYHLGYDPLELVDLIALDHAITASHPPWVDILCDKSRIRKWKGLWQNEKVNTATQHNLLFENKTLLSIEKSNAINNSSVHLMDMLDWADQAFEVARLWKNLVKQRYHYNSDVVSV